MNQDTVPLLRPNNNNNNNSNSINNNTNSNSNNNNNNNIPPQGVPPAYPGYPPYQNESPYQGTYSAPQYYYAQQPGYQQPGYQQPGYQQPAYQQPAYQQPGYSQPTCSQTTTQTDSDACYSICIFIGGFLLPLIWFGGYFYIRSKNVMARLFAGLSLAFLFLSIITIIIVFSIIFSRFSTNENCNGYYSCSTCVSSDCVWCPGQNTCYSIYNNYYCETTSNCDCHGQNDCNSCLSTGSCIWCAKSENSGFSGSCKTIGKECGYNATSLPSCSD